MKRICVFAGSSPGARDAYSAIARDLGRELVERDCELVYGGGAVGLMGVVADAVLGLGGRAIGIIPAALHEEVGIAHENLSELHIVGSMHERKSLMAELSNAFIALPGGLGTFEEFFEMLTWLQLGIHQKKCGLLNVEGYYDALMELVTNAVDERFVRPEHAAMVNVSTSPGELIDALFDPSPSASIGKWMAE